MNDMHNEVITALVILVQLFVLIFEVFKPQKTVKNWMQSSY